MNDYKVGDLVWAKMKGYSPWPGRVSIPYSELYAQKHSKKCVSIYFFGSNNYQWIKRDKLKPYLKYKEKMMKYCNTSALTHAVMEIEKYINNPEKFSDIHEGDNKVLRLDEFLEDKTNINLVKKEENARISEIDLHRIKQYVPLVKLEKTEIFPCSNNNCIKFFFSKNELERHLLQPVVLLERQKFISCKKCPCMFIDTNSYKKHVLKHVKASFREVLKKQENSDGTGRFKKRYDCPDCDRRFVEFSTLEQHSILHQPFPHNCYCGIGFYEDDDLARHKKLVHNEDSKPFSDVLHVEVNNSDMLHVEIDNSDVLPVEIDYSEATPAVEKKLSEEKENKPKKGKGKTKGKGKKPTVRRFTCKICSVVITSVGETKKHYIENHPDVKPYPCDKCSKTFFVPHALKIHQKQAHGDIKWQCQYCNKVFKAKMNLILHERTHTNYKPYSCDDCGKSFCQSGALKIHRLRHLKIRDFKCRYCEKSFYVKGSLQLHERIHTRDKMYKCNCCGKSFTDPSAYARHCRIHTSDKRYACKYCPKKFSDFSAYSGHLKREENQRDFECSICEKRFVSLDNLRCHLRTHPQLEGNRIGCPLCKKNFSSIATLNQHKETAHREEDRSCKICSKTFSNANKTKDHQYKAHKLGHPYKCKDCKLLFWTLTSINMHKLTVHTRKTHFSCDYCYKNFYYKKYLRSHITIKHLKWTQCASCEKYFSFQSYQTHIAACKGKPCDICDKTIPLTEIDAHLLIHAKNAK